MKTRKNKLRNLLKLGVLCFGISLLLFSCEKDTIIEKDTVPLNSELLSNINESIIPLSGLEYENNITQILNKPLKRKGSTLKSRSTNNIFSSFKDLPLEDKVIKYNVNNYTSYSIVVKQELSTSYFFQNIVIEKDNLKEAVYLISYYPDVNYQKLIKENKLLFGNDFTGSINIEYLYYKNKTTKSNSNRKASAKGTTGISDPFPLCAELHVPGRTCTAGGKHVHGQTCKGTRSQQPTAPYVIKVCTPSSMNGGGEVTTPNDIPEKCISCPDTSPSGPTTGGAGSTKTTKLNSIPWEPRYVCVITDPITGECLKLELDTPIISQPVVPNKDLPTRFNLTIEEKKWLNDGENIEAKNKIEEILKENNNSRESEKYVKKVIEILSNENLKEEEKFKEFKKTYNNFDPLLPNNTPKKGYETKIRKYATSFKQWGNKEFGNYLDSLLPLDTTFSDEDYKKLYETIRKKAGDLAWDYVKSIAGQTLESFEPVIEMALWEVGGGLALKVLKRLPVKYLTTPIRNVIKRLRTPSSAAFSKFKHAKKYGIKTYDELEKLFKKLNITRVDEKVQFHHLIEQRFKDIPAIKNWLGANAKKWKSIVLTKEEHQIFTNAWRKAIGYKGKPKGWTGYNTNNVPYNKLIEAAKKIYKDYPEILKALGL